MNIEFLIFRVIDLFTNNPLFLEAFGYLGTTLVVISMMMSSVTKLRIVNMSGSVISAIYAAICGTWPIVVMNVCLFVINGAQLIRGAKAKRAEKRANNSIS